MLKTGLMIRSNSNWEKQALVSRLQSLIDYIGGKLILEDDYPAWEYRANSPLRDTMTEAFNEMYGYLPQISSIHAGLECGILAEKLDGADMISFGPTMEAVHTPNERLSIKSVERCWKYLIKVLEMLK
jgi:dipeptidase D